MMLRVDGAVRFDAEGMLLEVIQQGTTSTIQLIGECDLAQQEKLRDAVRKAFAARPEHLVLDLSRLRFIDSTGIRAVVELNNRANHEDIRLVICPGSQQVQRVFELCGLTARLPFVRNGNGKDRSRGTPQPNS